MADREEELLEALRLAAIQLNAAVADVVREPGLDLNVSLNTTVRPHVRMISEAPSRSIEQVEYTVTREISNFSIDRPGKAR